MGSEILFFPYQFFVCDLPSELLKQAKASTKSKLNLDLIHEKRLALGLQGLICCSPRQVLTMATL